MSSRISISTASNYLVADDARFDDARIDVERFETTPQIDDGVALHNRLTIRRSDDHAVTPPESKYVGKISVQRERCVALHVRGDFLRDWLVCKFHASTFELIVERPNERLGAVVVSVFEVRVRFRFVAVFHRQSGVSNIVPVVRIVYLGEAALPITGETYATR